jgi:hypothetical protein
MSLSFETSEATYPTSQRHIPEDLNFNKHICRVESIHAYRRTESEFNRFSAGMRTRLKKTPKHLDLFDDRFNDAVTTTTCERTTEKCI